MNILLVNDDGISARGLNILADHIRKLYQDHRVIVVAPDRNKSGSSHALTLTHAITVNRLDQDIFSVQGTPADCVYLATSGLLDCQIDIVISGINHGINVGSDVLYSGTIAAAIQGQGCPLPSIAISLVGSGHFAHFDTAAQVVSQVFDRLLIKPLPGDMVLNINVPDMPLSSIQGYKITRLCQRAQAQDLIRVQDPRGREVYWVGLPGHPLSMEDTDFHALELDYVSITPLHIDHTDYKRTQELTAWLDEQASP